MINANFSKPAFGQLKVQYGKHEFTKENINQKPMGIPDEPEGRMVKTFIEKYSEDKRVKDLDKAGFDFVINPYIHINYFPEACKSMETDLGVSCMPISFLQDKKSKKNVPMVEYVKPFIYDATKVGEPEMYEQEAKKINHVLQNYADSVKMIQDAK